MYYAWWQANTYFCTHSMSSDHCTLPYQATGAFTKLVNDYVSGAPEINPFMSHEVSWEGIEAAIKNRLEFDTPRQALHEVLTGQYAGIPLHKKQVGHLSKLLDKNTFTVVTAHQPNIFTGPLYFIYKILHAIKLADELSARHSQYHFVPVYYMGSEDADLDELGFIFTGGEKLTWQTKQVGAVGRMNTEGLVSIIDHLKGRFSHLPFGKEMIAMLEEAYAKGSNIQQATLRLVNTLFAEFGLIVLIPDHPTLKAAYAPVIRRELLEQFSSGIVSQTIDRLKDHYKVQADGRDINLFYLFDDGRRERIEKTATGFRVLFSELNFTQEGLLQELKVHPERFSPNVILRGLFQETILPNIAFIGGGGELAYWLELKDLFQEAGVPYPVLVLRNSFLLVNERVQKLQKKLALSVEELFKPVLELEDLLVERLHGKMRDTDAAQQALEKLYEALKHETAEVDSTLVAHVGALHARARKGLEALAKKMQRAERRKISEETTQLEALRNNLFPNGLLQERLENFMPFYAQYGPALLQRLYNQSLTLEQQFTVSYLP